MYKSIVKDIYSIKNYEKAFFRLGVFLLPSAMAISLILFLGSMLIICFKYKNFYLKDKWNVSLLIATFFLLLSAIINSTNLNLSQYLSVQNNDISVYWVGLFNWIPLFIYFWICQFFLKTKKDRIIISNLLILGTLPLFFSIFTQNFLSWHGPLKTLNGLIIWYQYKGTPFSGFFNNASYTSCWLSIILPFAISKFNIYKLNKIKKIFFFFFTTISILGIILTQSIDSIFGVLITFAYLFFSDTFLALFTTFLSVILFLGITYKPVIYNLNLYLQKFNIFLNLYNFSISPIISKITIRLDIFIYNLTSIYQNSLFGRGNGSYKLNVEDMGNNLGKIVHSHNFFHEIAFSYGVFSCLFIAFPVLSILYLSFKRIYNLDNSNKETSTNKWEIADKAWFTAFFILLLSQLIDLQYFDARISCLFWLLLAGLKEIIEPNSDLCRVSKN